MRRGEYGTAISSLDWLYDNGFMLFDDNFKHSLLKFSCSDMNMKVDSLKWLDNKDLILYDDFFEQLMEKKQRKSRKKDNAKYVR